MAILAEPGGPSPPSLPRPLPPLERIEGLVLAAVAVILMAAILVRGAIVERERTNSLDTDTCQQRAFPLPNPFFLALH